jgi:two-component system, NarL family, nitrate/nitrite response regulator NarL
VDDLDKLLAVKATRANRERLPWLRKIAQYIFCTLDFHKFRKMCEDTAKIFRARTRSMALNIRNTQPTVCKHGSPQKEYKVMDDMTRNLSTRSNLGDVKEEEGKLKVLIADDHLMVSEILSMFLSETEGFNVFQSVSLETTLNQIENESGFDIILLDYNMPGLQSVEAVETVIKANRPGKVILFSGYVDNMTLRQTIKAGAHGLIPKSQPSKSVGRIISLVTTGEVFLPVDRDIKQHHNQSLMNINETERLILTLVAYGKTNKEIANISNESETLVKSQVRAICGKLGAKNRAHAALLGRDLNLID